MNSKPIKINAMMLGKSQSGKSSLFNLLANLLSYLSFTDAISAIKVSKLKLSLRYLSFIYPQIENFIFFVD